MKKQELPTSYAFDIFVFELFPLGKIVAVPCESNNEYRVWC